MGGHRSSGLMGQASAAVVLAVAATDRSKIICCKKVSALIGARFASAQVAEGAAALPFKLAIRRLSTAPRRRASARLLSLRRLTIGVGHFAERVALAVAVEGECSTQIATLGLAKPGAEVHAVGLCRVSMGCHLGHGFFRLFTFAATAGSGQNGNQEGSCTHDLVTQVVALRPLSPYSARSVPAHSAASGRKTPVILDRSALKAPAGVLPVAFGLARAAANQVHTDP